ncbi:MAG: iron-sulfur cluster biosynthesis protein [Lactobacillales bacterium]|jgi:uncharacterized protein YneR|nr:iron-sulfur cluster biosynthesis protein [Lactobacillales bacterium]
MKLQISERAYEWFEKELDLKPGSFVRFYGKVYGSTNVHEGFSVGMTVEVPQNIMASVERHGITYYVDQADDWFMANYDLYVDYDKTLEEPSYTFKEAV